MNTDASNGLVIIDGSIATYSPSINFNGSDSFIFNVSDGELISSASVSLTIQEVNDAPILTTIQDLVIDEDDSALISLSADDIDSDNLSFNIVGGDDITAVINGSDVSFVPAQNFNGSESFTISVSDDEFTNSQTINVTVSPIK